MCAGVLDSHCFTSDARRCYCGTPGSGFSPTRFLPVDLVTGLVICISHSARYLLLCPRLQISAFVSVFYFRCVRWSLVLVAPEPFTAGAVLRCSRIASHAPAKMVICVAGVIRQRSHDRTDND